MIPSTAVLYSSILGIRPKIADNTTTGVEANRDSPFLRSESSTTLPWKRRVEVAKTVSPFSAFSWLPMQRLQPGRSKYIIFSYCVRASPFGAASLNSKPEYKSYGEDCSLKTNSFPYITIKPIMDNFDMYVSAHLLGWFVKYLAIRNVKLAFFLSVLFEMMEITFAHWLPNFIECWWDQLILDIFGMNSLGIILGYFVVEYFKMKNYSKWYISHMEQEILTDDSLINLDTNNSKCMINNSTTTISKNSETQKNRNDNINSNLNSSKFPKPKPEELLKYFTPNEVDVYEWEIFTSSYRYFTILWLIGTVIGCDLSHFFLKSVLWLPITHKILAFRIFLWGFMCIIALREFYDYITDKNCKGLGPFVWLTQLILFVEWCIIIKFRENLMDTPFPDPIYYFWITIIFILCLIGIRLIVKDLYNLLFTSKKQVKDERLVINVAYHN